MTLGRLWDLYQQHIIGPGLQPHFVILVSTVELGGVHIHHLVPGILLLLGSGYALATLNIPRSRAIRWRRFTESGPP